MDFETIFLSIEAAGSMAEILELEQEMMYLKFDRMEKLTLTLLMRIQIQRLYSEKLENMIYDAYDQLGVDRKVRSATMEKRLQKEVKEGKIYRIADLKEKKKDEPEV